MLITAGCAPKARKGRTATVRPSTNLLISSEGRDSVRQARLQHLGARGIIGRRADLIAGIAWREVGNG